MPEMPALTVWEPWATLIAIGAKPYEFRGWHAPASHIGKRIAIHAGARPVRKTEVAELIVWLKGRDRARCCLYPETAIPFLEKLHANPKSLPTSHVVATAVLGTPILGTKVLPEFGGQVNDSDRDEHANWAWPMLDVRPLAPPVPAKGAQGFWRVYLSDEQLGLTAAA